MKRMLLAGILLLLAAPAYASDIMYALMDNGRGGQELHQQTTKGDGCEQLIIDLKRLRKEGQKMQLTFTAPPPFSGYVLEIHCIRPDGSIVSSDKLPKGERID